jgi:hypothetical protein
MPDIALHDADNTRFPNLALMKLSAWHKQNGDNVSWLGERETWEFNTVYSSKVFSFPNSPRPVNAFCAGTGWDIKIQLPKEIEHICPDYSLYGINYSLGFLTRGCPNKCCWCIVPEKEGDIRPHADIKEFAQHKSVVLMDNNVLASNHGVKQIEKIQRLGLSVDFNQGLDARLIDDAMARLLAKVHWLFPIRLACDSDSAKSAIEKAVSLLRWHNATPRRYFVYVLVQDIESALDRIRFLKGLDLDPFAQPYRDFSTNTEPDAGLKKLARWVNTRIAFKTMTWEQYKASWTDKGRKRKHA